MEKMAGYALGEGAKSEDWNRGYIIAPILKEFWPSVTIYLFENKHGGHEFVYIKKKKKYLKYFHVSQWAFTVSIWLFL